MTGGGDKRIVRGVEKPAHIKRQRARTAVLDGDTLGIKARCCECRVDAIGKQRGARQVQRARPSAHREVGCACLLDHRAGEGHAGRVQRKTRAVGIGVGEVQRGGVKTDCAARRDRTAIGGNHSAMTDATSQAAVGVNHARRCQCEVAASGDKPARISKNGTRSAVSSRGGNAKIGARRQAATNPIGATHVEAPGIDRDSPIAADHAASARDCARNGDLCAKGRRGVGPCLRRRIIDRAARIVDLASDATR